MNHFQSLKAKIYQVLYDALELGQVFVSELHWMRQNGNAARSSDHLQRLSRRESFLVEISQAAGGEVFVERLFDGGNISFAMKNGRDVRPADDGIGIGIFAGFFFDFF